MSTAKWQIRKRDGAWIVKGNDQIRYAASDWRMAYTFASMTPLGAAGTLIVLISWPRWER